jgi:hypothetical protein
MQYNKCYQCQIKDQVLGTSFCSVECKSKYLESHKQVKYRDSFAEKLAKFKETHLAHNTEHNTSDEEVVEYMDKLFKSVPQLENTEK